LMFVLLLLCAYIVHLLVGRARRFRSQQEITRIKNKLHAVLEHMPSAIILMDSAGRVTGMNKEAVLFCNVDEEVALGQPLREVCPWLADQVPIPDFESPSRHSLHLERVAFSKGDDLKYCNIFSYAIMDGEKREVVLRIDDASRQVKLEELMVNNDKIISLGEMAAGMAHEINNPLGVILQSLQNVERRLSASFLKNNPVAEQCGLHLDALERYMDKRGISNALKDIREAGVRAINIIKNTLELSRKETSFYEPCDMVSLAEDMITIAQNDFDVSSDFDIKKVRITLNHGPGPIYVSCSRPQIGQVFLNLVKNAVQALGSVKKPQFAPSLCITLSEDENTFYAEFADNGPGIPENIQNRIFEPFFTTKQPGKGTGLGLSVSFLIVTSNHGGTMTVESEPGGGARFFVALPKQSARTG